MMNLTYEQRTAIYMVAMEMILMDIRDKSNWGHTLVGCEMTIGLPVVPAEQMDEQINQFRRDAFKMGLNKAIEIVSKLDYEEKMYVSSLFGAAVAAGDTIEISAFSGWGG